MSNQELHKMAFAPMLCHAATTPPEGPAWVYEVKWDGVRALLYLDPVARTGQVQGRQSDLTRQFPDLAALWQAVPVPCVLDGEIVAFREGVPDFPTVSRRVHGTAPWLIHAVPVVFVAFDVLQVGRQDVTGLPWAERRPLLDALLPPTHPRLQLSQPYDDGAALLRAVAAQAGEGIVAKRRESRYQCGRRTETWQKIKVFHETTRTLTAYEVNPAGITGLTAEGDRIHIAGGDAPHLRLLLDAGHTPTIAIQYLSEADGHLRFPTYRGMTD